MKLKMQDCMKGGIGYQETLSDAEGWTLVEEANAYAVWFIK
jgi:hypothetical protein